MEKFKRKILLVGDLHGNFDLAVKLTYWARRKGYSIVYYGDLTDSFEYSKRDQLKTLLLVIDQLKAGRAWCLWGNHDLSYINSPLFACSGYTPTKEKYFKEAYKELLNHPRFTPFIDLKWEEDKKILLTHAGLAPEMVPVRKDPIEFLEESFKDRAQAFNTPMPLLMPGKLSGGRQPVGGITWLRSGETQGGFPNLIQIVGHTAQGAIDFDSKRNTYYIDTLIASSNQEVILLDLDLFKINIFTSKEYLV